MSIEKLQKATLKFEHQSSCTNSRCKQGAKVFFKCKDYRNKDNIAEMQVVTMRIDIIDFPNAIMTCPQPTNTVNTERKRKYKQNYVSINGDHAMKKQKRSRPKSKDEKDLQLVVVLDHPTKLKRNKLMAKKHNSPRESKVVRCNFRQLVTFINTIQSKIPESHLEAMMDTPFGSLFNAIYTGIINSETVGPVTSSFAKIMSAYDDAIRGFRIGGKILTITADDIALTFGLPKHGKYLRSRVKIGEKYKPCTFQNRVFPGLRKIHKTNISAAIEKVISIRGREAAEDFVRCIILYMMVTIFDPNANYTVGVQFLENLDQFSEIKNICWANIFHRNLITMIRKNYRKPRNTPGVVVAVNYWLCEHSKVSQPIPYLKSSTPRCARWDLSSLLDQVEGTDLVNLKGVTQEIRNISEEEQCLLTECLEGDKEEEQEEEEKLEEEAHEEKDESFDEVDLMGFREQNENEALREQVRELNEKLEDETSKRLEFESSLRDLMQMLDEQRQKTIEFGSSINDLANKLEEEKNQKLEANKLLNQLKKDVELLSKKVFELEALSDLAEGSNQIEDVL